MVTSRPPVILLFQPGEKALVGLYRPTVSDPWTSLPVPQTRDENALLITIQQLLDRWNLTVTDLTAIGVFPGPASYIMLRLHITTANTLAWGLNLPIFPLPAEAPLPEAIPSALATAKRGVTIEPIYPHNSTIEGKKF